MTGTDRSGLRLSTLVSEGFPLRLAIPEVVASDNGRGVSCLLVFFLPLVFPTITVLLETAAFEAVRHDEVDGADNEADASASSDFEGPVLACWLRKRLGAA